MREARVTEMVVSSAERRVSDGADSVGWLSVPFSSLVVSSGTVMVSAGRKTRVETSFSAAGIWSEGSFD